ncbi:MAG: hypothetical protein LW636_01850 [Planctomycetaceae bacterium]|nr:hypothetical protein [Planctomycetaceae bacterium]
MNNGPDATAFAPRAAGPALAAFTPAVSAEIGAGQSAVFTVTLSSGSPASGSMAIDCMRTRDGAGASLGLAVTFTESSNPADLDGNGTVDAADLATLLAAWGACTGCPADLDGNGTVDAADLAMLLAAWGT